MLGSPSAESLQLRPGPGVVVGGACITSGRRYNYRRGISVVLLLIIFHLLHLQVEPVGLIGRDSVVGLIQEGIFIVHVPLLEIINIRNVEDPVNC